MHQNFLILGTDKGKETKKGDTKAFLEFFYFSISAVCVLFEIVLQFFCLFFYFCFGLKVVSTQKEFLILCLIHPHDQPFFLAIFHNI